MEVYICVALSLKYTLNVVGALSTQPTNRYTSRLCLFLCLYLFRSAFLCLCLSLSISVCFCLSLSDCPYLFLSDSVSLSISGQNCYLRAANGPSLPTYVTSHINYLSCSDPTKNRVRFFSNTFHSTNTYYEH